jgi:hypothetical protein
LAGRRATAAAFHLSRPRHETSDRRPPAFVIATARLIRADRSRAVRQLCEVAQAFLDD